MTTALQVQTLAQIPISTPHRSVAANLIYKDVWTADERADVIDDAKRRYDTIDTAGTDVEEAKRRVAVITSGHGITATVAKQRIKQSGGNDCTWYPVQEIDTRNPESTAGEPKAASKFCDNAARTC